MARSRPGGSRWKSACRALSNCLRTPRETSLPTLRSPTPRSGLPPGPTLSAWRTPPGAPGQPGTSTDSRVVNVLTIRGRDQVMLKVTVAEVSRDVAKQLGITTSSLTASWGAFTQFNPFAIKNVIAQPPFDGIGYPPL